MRRKFPCSDTDMLIVCKTLFLNLRKDLAYLKDYQQNWTEEYIDEWLARIAEAENLHIGKDHKGSQRAATLSIVTQFATIKDSMSLMHKQIKRNFPDHEEILKQLGYSRYWKNAASGRQSDVQKLLHAFEKGVTEKMRTRLTTIISPTVLDGVLNKISDFASANVEQEFQKVNTPLSTADANAFLNMIYQEAINLASAAQSVYSKNKTNRVRFSFSHLLSKLRRRRTNGDNIDPNTLGDAD